MQIAERKLKGSQRAQMQSLKLSKELQKGLCYIGKALFRSIPVNLKEFTKGSTLPYVTKYLATVLADSPSRLLMA